MTLLHKTYGKGRVRVMRVHRDGARHEVRELTVQAMLTGGFDPAFTHADNATTVSTDTVKNVVNIVARESMALPTEEFCRAVAQRLLDAYPVVETATVTAHETKWDRLAVDGSPHPHAFTLDGNGRATALVRMSRDGVRIESGVAGFTFLKTTESGWANYLKDPYTTIRETDDRLAATSMEASWLWSRPPADYPAANARILGEMLRVFATTYSHSIQDSLYRMGQAALAAVPEIETVSMACPNKHYLLVDLTPFGLDNANQVFVATDEPHGQIECTVGR
ncbi:factor-independent urate hydroxylase [Methylobacterium isbiliense]|jgi:urate oxidase|uniref:Uricase n=1 Tax=Methylobacterium isbiliense TaxID=315478 RepID=A0ABQ4SF43_9HYPH|nr:urate oxidase [Methylobacterium isbiliense]MDN3624266.1 urate oxidase [Methylobacterium isbiliense]GJE01018.1 Uricase [Methylobacterium isbiliense]